MIGVNIHFIDDDLAGGYDFNALPSIGDGLMLEQPHGDGTTVFRVVDIVHILRSDGFHYATMKVKRDDSMTDKPHTTQPCPVCAAKVKAPSAHHKRFDTDAENDAWLNGHEEGWNDCLHEWNEQIKVAQAKARTNIAVIRAALTKAHAGDEPMQSLAALEGAVGDAHET